MTMLLDASLQGDCGHLKEKFRTLTPHVVTHLDGSGRFGVGGFCVERCYHA